MTLYVSLDRGGIFEDEVVVYLLLIISELYGLICFISIVDDDVRWLIGTWGFFSESVFDRLELICELIVGTFHFFLLKSKAFSAPTPTLDLG